MPIAHSTFTPVLQSRRNRSTSVNAQMNTQRIAIAVAWPSLALHKAPLGCGAVLRVWTLGPRGGKDARPPTGDVRARPSGRHPAGATAAPRPSHGSGPVSPASRRSCSRIRSVRSMATGRRLPNPGS